MARAFFERSGRARLHIDMPNDITRTVGSLAELRQQSRRISTLKLRNWPIQKKLLSEPLPSLKRLEIFSSYYGNEDESDENIWGGDWDVDIWDEDIWESVSEQTKEATSWSFPSLTSLIVYGVNPTSFYAPNLTCFKFRHQDCHCRMGGLVGFLGNCPLLEHIDISYVHTSERMNPDLVVSLPNLRTYTQTDSVKRSPLAVLNMLSLPPLCSVTLKLWSDRGTTELDYILLPFENPDYLAEIKRVKLKVTDKICGSEVAGALELVNAKGTKVCSERMVHERIERQPYAHRGTPHPPNVAHLDFIRNLDGRSVEILCIDGYSLLDVRGVAIEFLKKALGFGNVRTLILSRSAVEPCLSALNGDPGASDYSRWFLPIHNLIIYSSEEGRWPPERILQPLLSVAQRREVAGFPFESISLFFRYGLGWDEVLDRLERCVGKLEVVIGDGALDWDVDKYFLDGLEHLQGDRDLEWD